MTPPGLCVEGCPTRLSGLGVCMPLPQARAWVGAGAALGLKPWREGPHHRPVCVGGALRLLRAASEPARPRGHGAVAPVWSALHPEPPLLGRGLWPDPGCRPLTAGSGWGCCQPPVGPPQPPSLTWTRSVLAFGWPWRGQVGAMACVAPTAPGPPPAPHRGAQPGAGSRGVCLGALTQACPRCLRVCCFGDKVQPPTCLFFQSSCLPRLC